MEGGPPFRLLAKEEIWAHVSHASEQSMQGGG